MQGKGHTGGIMLIRLDQLLEIKRKISGSEAF